MYPSLVLTAALVAPAAPVPRDAAPAAAGPAPRVLALKADATGAVRVVATLHVKQTVTATTVVLENNQPVQKQVEYDTVLAQYVNKPLAEFGGTFSTADGRPLTADEATARVKAGATVLASADGRPVGKGWLQAAAPDTVVVVADGLAHASPQWGGDPFPTTPPPQLSLLAAADRGGVLARVTGSPAGGDAVYGEAVEWNGGGRMVVRGRGGIRFAGDGPPGHPGAIEPKVFAKPLAEVPFDAYDRAGKLVPRAEALKRLAAGGLVLVAGDARMPDDAYLKGFRDDVLVLVGGELVLPVPPLDQTKKKPSEKPRGIFRD